MSDILFQGSYSAPCTHYFLKLSFKTIQAMLILIRSHFVYFSFSLLQNFYVYYYIHSFVRQGMKSNMLN